MIYLKLIFCCCFTLLFFCPAFCQQKNSEPGYYDDLSKLITADSTAKFNVISIAVSGNKKTKTYIILREMAFKEGDSIQSLQLLEKLVQSRYQVYNTNLFTEVEIKYSVVSKNEIVFNVAVKEKWYIYPTPQFQLVDRNLNEWIKTYHADFNRVIYGAKFAHYNFSGRRDQLRIYLLNGYARNVSFSYIAPYSNSSLTEGFSVAGGYTQNREIAYKTNYYNKSLQYKTDGFVRNSFSIGGSYSIRKGHFKSHAYSLSYTHINVDDTVISSKYNPAYFNSKSSSQGFPDIAYSFQYSNTDNINYPLKGEIYGIGILKRGLSFTGGINMLSLDGSFNKFIKHKNNFASSIQFFGRLKLPFTQPYINQRALGYGEFYPRGLELYVIDGVASAVTRYTLKKKILSFNIPVPFHIKILPKIPFTIFAKTYADAGYSYNKPEFNTRLNNRFLYSGGFGVDILTLYDINLRVEYSFNQLGENGLFLHSKGGF